MPSNNSKNTEEFREQTAKMILETGKSATSTAEEMGIIPIPSVDGSEITEENTGCPVMQKKKALSKDRRRMPSN